VLVEVLVLAAGEGVAAATLDTGGPCGKKKCSGKTLEEAESRCCMAEMSEVAKPGGVARWLGAEAADGHLHA
jgi:hypothetical protein